MARLILVLDDETTQTLAELDEQDGYKCQECNAVRDDALDALYECGSCGTRFTRDNSADGGSNRCPDCNKFGTKVADNACAECEEGEALSVVFFTCPACRENVALDEYGEHLLDGCR